MKPRHPPEIASSQKDHVTDNKLAYHELGRSENSQPAQMNLISHKEFKGDALESLRGVMILSSIHWRTRGPFTIHESLHFLESVSESCMIQLTYVFSLVSYRWYMYPLSLSSVIYNLVLP